MMSNLITHDVDQVAKHLAHLPADKVPQLLPSMLDHLRAGADARAQHYGRLRTSSQNEASELRAKAAQPDFPDETEVDTHARRAKVLVAVAVGLGLAATILNAISFSDVIESENLRYGFAAFAVALTAAAFHQFLQEVGLPRPRPVHLALCTIAVLVALGGQAYMAHMRADVIVEEIRQTIRPTEGAVETADAPVITDGTDIQPRDPVIERFFQALQKAMVLLMLALEITMGLLFHYIMEALHNRYRKTYQNIRRLDHLDANMDYAMQLELAKKNMTIDDLNSVHLRYRQRFEQLRSPQLWSAVVITVALLLLLFFLSRDASAQTVNLQPAKVENIGFIIDLSYSMPPEDIQAYSAAILRGLTKPQLGARYLVVAATDDAWANPQILLDARVSSDPGFMNRTLMTAQNRLQQMWMAKARELAPKYKESDIMGAIALTARLLRVSEVNPARIYILSDMRQTKGVNIEKPNEILIEPALNASAQLNLIPNLRGAKVWVMGVQTRGKNQDYFFSLHCFWVHWFAASGADLRQFGIDIDSGAFKHASPSTQLLNDANHQLSTSTSAGSPSRCPICQRADCPVSLASRWRVASRDTELRTVSAQRY